VEHETGAVAAALGDLGRAGHPLLLVFAASAIVDREDVVPAGLVAAGGAIERLGMPVDPGNLLLMGRLGPTPVVGIPSCAASPKLNGFDWVLERLAAGISVSSADIAVMGVGGLLKEIASRPQPRDPAASHVAPRHRPIIGAVVLAAGRSTRMGSNKLLEIVGGKPIVRHVVEAIRASSVASVHVVVGHMEDAVRAALDGIDVAFVTNRRFAEGLSTSVKTGIDALPAGVEGALVALGDMPEIGGGEIDRLIAAFAPADNRSIVVPTWRGKRGNPVLWAAQYFPELRALSGDSGAKHLLGIHAEAVAEVEWAGPAAVTDIDTPEALAALRNRVAAP
jgi:molybdenum cofactor cytidylyltransferase